MVDFILFFAGLKSLKLSLENWSVGKQKNLNFGP